MATWSTSLHHTSGLKNYSRTSLTHRQGYEAWLRKVTLASHVTVDAKQPRAFQKNNDNNNNNKKKQTNNTNKNIQSPGINPGRAKDPRQQDKVENVAGGLLWAKQVAGTGGTTPLQHKIRWQAGRRFGSGWHAACKHCAPPRLASTLLSSPFCSVPFRWAQRRAVIACVGEQLKLG